MRGCACRGTAGFAHVSCLAEQAKILLAEAEEMIRRALIISIFTLLKMSSQIAASP